MKSTSPFKHFVDAELVIEALRRRIRQLHPICFKLNQNKGTNFQIRLESDSDTVRNREIWNAETVDLRNDLDQSWISRVLNQHEYFHGSAKIFLFLLNRPRLNTIWFMRCVAQNAKNWFVSR